MCPRAPPPQATSTDKSPVGKPLWWQGAGVARVPQCVATRGAGLSGRGPLGPLGARASGQKS
eukprot:9495245-Heterocapsa_arctica.AAC.1